VVVFERETKYKRKNISTWKIGIKKVLAALLLSLEGKSLPNVICRLNYFTRAKKS